MKIIRCRRIEMKIGGICFLPIFFACKANISLGLFLLLQVPAFIRCGRSDNNC